MQTKLLIDGVLVAGEGAVERILDPATGKCIAEVAEAIRSMPEIKAVAVCFLFSYLNPAHEQRAKAILKQMRREAAARARPRTTQRLALTPDQQRYCSEIGCEPSTFLALRAMRGS